MKILLASRELTERTRLATSLREAGHEVRVAETIEQAQRLLEAARSQVVLFEPEPPFEKGVEFAKKVRALAGADYIYTILLASSLTDPQLLAAYEAGVDHHLPIPANSFHVRSRLAAAARITKASDSKSASTAPAATAATVAAKGVAGSGGEGVFGGPAWRMLPEEIGATLSTFLVLKVSTKDLGNVAAEQEVVAGIVLANVAQGFEVRIAIGVDALSAKSLAKHVFGEDDMEMAVDMLSEVANLIMGTVKTVFGKESIVFTGGLPVALQPADFSKFNATCQQQETFTFVAASAAIAVRIGVVLAKKNEVVAIGKLREGMVLAADVQGARGVLLVRGGTRLSATMADQLRRALPANQMVEVAIGAS